MTMPKKIELNEEVAAKYMVIGEPVSSRFIHRTLGEINFRKMTLKQADLLFQSGKFPYLAKREKNKTVKK